MRPVRALLCVGLLSALAVAPARSADAIRIVAAENFYGDVAQQIGGPAVQVVSVLRNPDADPHLFEIDVATARAISAANLVIYNGGGYDPWMARLLRTQASSARHVIEVAALIHAPPALANPHFWYDPATMPMLARALTAQLQRIDRAHSAGYGQRLEHFLGSLQLIQAKIMQLQQHYAGQPVTATEPLANDMTATIGLAMRNQGFQLAIMNNTEPGATETAAFEQSLRSRSVRVLIYNRQASSNTVQHMLAIARQSRIPIVDMTETEPAGLDYQDWMLDELSALGQGLADWRP